MLTLHTNLDPVRRSLLLALGLIGACGGENNTTATDSGSTGASSPSSSSSGEPTGTGDTGVSTSEPTGTASATGTGSSSSDGESGTTLATSGLSATEATATGDTSTGDTSTGGSSSTTDEETTFGPNCFELMQATDPPIPSGWIRCEGRLPQRVEAVKCEVPKTTTPCTNMDQGNQCDVDSDCTEQPFGSCNQFSFDFVHCGCVYGCETDDDCEPGSVCRCAGPELGPFSVCTPSTCTDNNGCDDGEVCQFANSYGEDCPDEVNDGHCSTPSDTCDSDFLCGNTGCMFIGDSWNCSNTICGRPFVVESEAITADATERGDWGALVAAPAATPELAERLADHWTRIGLFEHASVASFARYVLQLLAVGAPAALVSEAQRALADEVEHARVCFALASLYKGTGVGPGPLPQAHDAGVSGLADITAAVIREACVGETLSALEVRESAARAVDPALRQVLTKIADDEQRHAELGWRFVQWALARMDADGRARAAEVFTAAIADAERQVQHMAEEPGAPELRDHGVIDAPLRAVVWGHGLRSIVAPSAAALAV